MRKYPDRPFVAIGVAVHHKNNILLIKRGKEPNKGLWSLPGGTQNLGETVFEAAKREVLEETDIHISDETLIEVVDSIHTDDDGNITYHYTIIEISALYLTGDIKAQSDADDAKWVPVSELEQYEIPPKTHNIIMQSYRSRNASLTDA